MDTSPESVSGFGSRRRRVAGHFAHCLCGNLSVTAGAIYLRLSGRHIVRHCFAVDRPVAVAAAWPAIRRRGSAWRRHQYRHRGGGACGARRLHAALGHSDQRDQRHRVRQSQFQFHPRHRAGRQRHARPRRGDGQPGGAGEDYSGVHCLCQSQSGQDQHVVARHRQHQSRRRRAVQDDGRRGPGSRALSHQPVSRSARRAGAGHVQSAAVVPRFRQVRQAACARGDFGDERRYAAGRAARGRIRAGL